LFKFIKKFLLEIQKQNLNNQNNFISKDQFCNFSFRTRGESHRLVPGLGGGHSVKFPLHAFKFSRQIFNGSGSGSGFVDPAEIGALPTNRQWPTL
jgi:hypothetical protein